MEELSYYEDESVVEQWARYADDGFEPTERELVDEYFTDTDAAVLDLGCGTGRTSKPLADRGYDVVGVDLSESLIERARTVHPDVTFRVGDATDLDFPDGSFEYVLFAGRGLDDIPSAADRMRALLQVRRVLKPGGVFVFDAKNRTQRYLFDPRSLDEWRETVRFLVRNARAGSLGSRYAVIEFAHGVGEQHAILPRTQRRQLADIGFDVLDVVKQVGDPRPLHLDPRPFYVARKPAESLEP